MTILVAASASAPSLFNPVSAIAWHSLFWAEGTAFQARGYANNGEVGNWPDEMGGAPIDIGSGEPKYYTAITNLRSRPGVTFIGENRLRTNSFVGPSYTSGVSMVVIFDATSTATAQTLIAGGSGIPGLMWTNSASGNSGIDCGGTPITNSTAASTGQYLFVAFHDGSTGSEWLEENGTQTATGNAGSDTFTTSFVMGRKDLTNWFVGSIVLAGLYEGDFTADAQYLNFTNWVTSHYGITIS